MIVAKIPKPSTPMVDPKTGLITRDWYLYNQQQDQRATATDSTIAGSTLADWIPLLIQYPDNVAYPIGIACPFAITVTSVVVKTEAGTATVGVTGAASFGSFSATSTQTATAVTGTIPKDGGFTVTVSGVSSDCVNLSISLIGSHAASA